MKTVFVVFAGIDSEFCSVHSTKESALIGIEAAAKFYPHNWVIGEDIYIREVELDSFKSY